MSSRLNDVVIYGGGAKIGPLVDILKDRIKMNVMTLGESFPEYDQGEDFDITSAAVGALIY